MNTANYFFNPHAIPLILVGLLIFLGGVFILHRQKYSPLGLSYFIMSFFCGLWLIPTGFGYLCLQKELAEFWFRIDNIGVMFLSSSTYLFITIFLGTHRKRIPIIILGFSISLFFTVSLFIKGWITIEIQKFYWGYFPKWGNLAYLFLVFFFVYMVIIFLELHTAHKQSSSLKRNQIKYFILAYAVTYTAIINYLPAIGIPVYPLGFASLLGYFLIVTYAITKHRLMDIKIIINRLMAFIILISIYASIGLLLLFLYNQMFVFGFNLKTLLFIIFIIIMGGLFFHPLRLLIQTTPDKFIFKKKYLFDQTISDFAKVSTENLKVKEAVEIFEKKVINAVKTKKVDIRLFDSNSRKNN